MFVTKSLNQSNFNKLSTFYFIINLNEFIEVFKTILLQKMN